MNLTYFLNFKLEVRLSPPQRLERFYKNPLCKVSAGA